jgi:hypothetical protein
MKDTLTQVGWAVILQYIIVALAVVFIHPPIVWAMLILVVVAILNMAVLSSAANRR